MGAPRYRFLALIFILMLNACATQRQPAEITPSRPEDLPFVISGVSLDRRVFNPSQGETVGMSFHLSHPAKAIVKIFDPEARLVQDLLPEDTGTPELFTVVWDGRDLEGNMVPDEAYFFTIEALDYQGETASYDPTTFSGGEYFDLPVEFDRGKGLVRYTLPKDARVSVRAGISQGPLLMTILNQAPRLAGENVQGWDGKDESGNVEATTQDGFKLLAEAMSMPENSILAIGNAAYTYFEYSTEIAPERPKKVERPLFRNENTQAAMLLGRSFQTGLEPRFYLELPQDIARNADGLPVLAGKVPVKVYLDKSIKHAVIEQRYEIICFADFEFVTEQEEGYSPSTWVWDTTKVPDGPHILTVNTATLNGQKASASIKVVVQN